MSICKTCKKPYDREEIIELHGEGFPFGYCSECCLIEKKSSR